MASFGSTLRDLAKKVQEDFHKDSYLNALFNTQALEIQLRVLLSLCIQSVNRHIIKEKYRYQPKSFKKDTLDKLIKKLEIFYPKDDFQNLHKSVESATESRNQFIHSVFKIKVGKYEMLNFSENRISHPDSIKKMKNWENDYLKATLEISKLISDFHGFKIKADDL